MTIEKAIAEFSAHLAASMADNSFVRVALSNPVAGSDAPPRLLVRRIDLKGVPHLSFTARHATRDVTSNRPLAEGVTWLRQQLRRHYRSALLGTVARDWQLVIAANDSARLIAHQPAKTEPPPRTHDQPHETILDASARDWLTGLGVMNNEGKVRAALADKHRQINRYLEIFTHLARDCGWTAAPRGPKKSDKAQAALVALGAAPEPAARELVLADMGCGKAYLTFGLWHLFSRVWHRPARILGVETRAELVAGNTALAQRLAATRLEFLEGDIASVKLPPLDALIALHACNTATDAAIHRGIELEAQLIVVSPCCHQEIRPQLGHPEPLAAILRHGLMQERLAEWLTDGLRALFLEWAGYRTRMIEFVGSEHTQRNLMIAAVREGGPFQSAPARQRILELKQFFGLRTHALDPLLDR